MTVTENAICNAECKMRNADNVGDLAFAASAFEFRVLNLLAGGPISLLIGVTWPTLRRGMRSIWTALFVLLLPALASAQQAAPSEILLSFFHRFSSRNAVAFARNAIRDGPLPRRHARSYGPSVSNVNSMLQMYDDWTTGA